MNSANAASPGPPRSSSQSANTSRGVSSSGAATIAARSASSSVIRRPPRRPALRLREAAGGGLCGRVRVVHVEVQRAGILTALAPQVVAIHDALLGRVQVGQRDEGNVVLRVGALARHRPAALPAEAMTLRTAEARDVRPLATRLVAQDRI